MGLFNNSFGLLGIAVFGLETFLISFIHFQVALSATFSLWNFMQCRLAVSYLCFGTYWLVASSRGGRSVLDFFTLADDTIHYLHFPICCFRSS
jgi:hypothetical protein